MVKNELLVIEIKKYSIFYFLIDSLAELLNKRVSKFILSRVDGQNRR